MNASRIDERTMVDPQDDAILVEQVRNGNREAFRSIVERYSGLVYHIAYSMCHHPQNAQDAVQEVFYRAYKAIGSYNPQWAFKTWLRRITVNYLLDQKKKKNVDAVSMTQEDDSVYEFSDRKYDPAQAHYQNERELLLRKAVSELPEKQRMAITLRHFDDLSYEEIAEIMEMPLGTVMTQIHRGRKSLAERLETLQNELMYDPCGINSSGFPG